MAESAFLCSWQSTIEGGLTEAETVGAERTKVGALQLSSEGHTSRGELGAQRSHSEIWGWTSLADLQLTKMTPFYGEQAGREARVDMRKQRWSSRHSGDHPGMVTMVMQRGGGVWEYQSLRQNKSVDSRRGERSSVSGSRTG